MAHTEMTRRVFNSTFVGATLSRAGSQKTAFSITATRQLKDYLQSQIDAGVIPGAKVAARRHGTLFVELYLGTYRDQNAARCACEPRALHPFFSVSKMVSATAVMMAAQDGLLDIDAPVARYVPEFAANGKSAITIRQCLSHSAGIPTSPPGLHADNEENWKQFVAAVCAKTLEWEPGTRTEYHGANGIIMAAEAVRRHSNGRSWNAICRERIFGPLGLDSFTFDAPPSTASIVMLPAPNSPASPRDFYASSIGFPGAGCFGNISDLLKFLRFQTTGGMLHGKPLLHSNVWADMHRDQFSDKPTPMAGKPGFESWGLGMMVRGRRLPTSSLNWFGIHNQTAPRLFSHAGTNCALGVGDPDEGLEIGFFTTDSPITKAKAAEMRNKVTDTVYANLK
ncbi:MAG TPA: serine hydrolase domain-containing protein [Bryobacteraceae bacterium]|jgi:CubicO group peptidase (beta-lactamase class C family)|nr:serine hydrolase domain-containing protein [Bryobacteraceae bacterium]